MNLPRFQSDLLAAAAEGMLLLTANNRLARHLLRLYDERMQAAGCTCWPSPAIHSADAWLATMAGNLDEGWRILSPGAAQCLWEEVVDNATAGSELGLLQVPSSARRAREAHELLIAYAVDCDRYPLTEDHRVFLHWREMFRASCTSRRLLDPAGNADRVAAGVTAGEVPLPPQLWLVGFDELPPPWHRLAAAAAGAECRVIEAPAPTAPAGELRRLACRDAPDEVRHAARWARGLLEAGEGQIGIIVPDLSAYQSLIERIFREELDPQALLACSDEELRFNLTLGAPLARQGPVAAALEILAATSKLTLDAVSFLLRTPYLGAAQTESERRALLDRNLRSLRSETFSLASMKGYCRGERVREGKWLGSRSPVMADIFDKLDDGVSNRTQRLPGAWAAEFSRLLAQIGWPGERPLDSRDYQVVKEWREKLLSQFAALDAVSRRLDRHEAVALLRRMANELQFQPETPAAGIQVCGVLEAGGLHFDHLWVLGLHEVAWPAPARPNPFLPVALQSACGMPHADAAREGAFARRVMARLQAAAPTVVFSHPLQQGDCALRPSPMIVSLPTAPVLLAPGNAPHLLIRQETPALEALVDVQGPSLASGEVAKGGTAILRDQALCPFRAFAHHRLAARSLELGAPGLDPATRGTLVHGVLERFWEATGSHAALIALGDGSRRERIRVCAAAALEAHFATVGARPPETLLRIEQERLEGLVEEWLQQVEMERTPFTCLEREQEHEESFGGLAFRTKVDRIDVLADGRRAIIDYKTGRVDLGDLLGERLLEPQLPIYGIGEGGVDLAAVAIASLRRGDCNLKGVARDGDVLPGVVALAGSKQAERYGLAGWEELLVHWRRQLDALGDDFSTGVSRVDPIDMQKACRTCDLATLCRIDEASGPLAGEGEEG